MPVCKRAYCPSEAEVIGEKTEKKSQEKEGEMKFNQWAEMDRELWVQVMKAEGEEVTNIIQVAAQFNVVGSEAWRALKARYDPESVKTLETWRGDLFKVKRCETLEELPKKLL